jgi:hypothetical protein
MLLNITVGIVIGSTVMYYLMRPKKGHIYQHYKKKTFYEVLMEGLNSEDPTEKMTVYQSLEDGEIWIRPSWMFHETVGFNTRRFRRIEY